MIALLLGLAAAQECPALSEPPTNVQVAWVSPVRRQVRANATLEVVRVEDLADFAREHKADQARVLQVLELAGKRGGWRSRRLYKVVVFEVRAEQLCRPVEGAAAGEVVAGVRACGHGGCGTTTDRLTGEPGVEVYEISWREAARWGFCVVPLEFWLQEL